MSEYVWKYSHNTPSTPGDHYHNCRVMAEFWRGVIALAEHHDLPEWRTEEFKRRLEAAEYTGD